MSTTFTTLFTTLPTKYESLSSRVVTRGQGVVMPLAPRSLNNAASTVLSSIQYIYSQKTLGSNRGHQTCFLPWVPSNIGTPLLSSLAILIVLCNRYNINILSKCRWGMNCEISALRLYAIIPSIFENSAAPI